MPIDFNIKVDLMLVAKQNPNVKIGGRYRPSDCVSPHKVAIIIPYRNRYEHLKYWLYYLHPILQRQQLDYGIYVINQVKSGVMERVLGGGGLKSMQMLEDWGDSLSLEGL